ncbi:MAG TPA: PEP-CTERM sorting domain-containing protein [Candidatus Acidoferrales bacterium]|jgi:hypothetical protein|nr:PEP-CTERM sorting domain-containing protein [Terriglobales bacterium]
MKRLVLVIALALLLLPAMVVAHADSVVPVAGETIAISGIATQTSGSGCCTHGGPFTGTFTLGAAPSGMDWPVTALSIDSTGFGCSFGQTQCAALVWTISLQFDAGNDTLFGTASVSFIGGGGDHRFLTITLIDGNTTTDPWTNLDTDVPDHSNDRAGTLSYNVAPVPEPSTLLLLSSGAFGILGVIRRRFRA